MYSCTHTLTNTQTDRREIIHVFDTTDRCCYPVPAVPCLAPYLRWVAFGANNAPWRNTYTLIYTLTTTIITSDISDSLDLCAVHRQYFRLSVCSGWECVYHLEQCTVFGNVKNSPQWSGVIQTHSYWMGLRFLSVHLRARVRNLNTLTCCFTLGDLMLLCVFGKWMPTYICLSLQVQGLELYYLTAPKTSAFIFLTLSSYCFHMTSTFHYMYTLLNT